MFTNVRRINDLVTTENFSQADIECIAKMLCGFHDNTQLAIAKIHHGNLSFYGALKSNGRMISIENPSAVFEIGSITKVFTSTLMVMMASQGLLSIDDSIDTYLGYPLNNNTKITFKELANHTAGLPRLPPSMLWRAIFIKDENPYKNYTKEQLIEYLKHQLKRKNKPKYRYSNLGVGILGYVLTQIANKSYEECLQEYIFKPLAMRESTTQRDKVKPFLVGGLNKKGKPTSHWDLASLAGAGAILSSVHDLASFVMANFDKENAVFKQQREKTFQVNGMLSLALGWHIYTFKKPEIDQLYVHDGGTGGYRSVLGMDLSTKNSVIILSNISGLHFIKSGKLPNLAVDLMQNMMDNK